MPHEKSMIQDSSEDEENAETGAEINHQMLMAVALRDRHALGRLIENSSSAWLGSDESRSDNPEVNACLAAMLCPGDTEMIEVFDDFFGDVRHWQFGRWSVVHWAIAGKHEQLLKWALRDGSKDHRHRHGVSIMDCEGEDKEHYSKVRRNGLAIAVQVGDPQWIATVVALAEAEGCVMEKITRRDRFATPCAMGVALLELALAYRQGDGPEEIERRVACAQLLLNLGYHVDGRVPSGKLAAALALGHPNETAKNRAMAPAIRLAMTMGSGLPLLREEPEIEKRGKNGGLLRSKKLKAKIKPMKAMEAAGYALDERWAKALELCGLSEPKDGCFGMGAARRLHEELFTKSNETSWSWAKNADAFRVIKLMECSIQDNKIPAAKLGLGGMEIEIARWMIKMTKESATKSQASSAKELARQRERVELAMVAPIERDETARKSRVLRV